MTRLVEPCLEPEKVDGCNSECLDQPIEVGLVADQRQRMTERQLGVGPAGVLRACECREEPFPDHWIVGGDPSCQVLERDHPEGPVSWIVMYSTTNPVRR